MRLLLHAITPSAEAAAELSGFRGDPLITVDFGGLTGWASEVPDGDLELTRDDVLAHHRLIAAIDARSEATLPARLPTYANHAEALRDQLRTRQDQLSERLERVRGCCELAVTAVWTDPDVPEPPAEALTPGRRYMALRQAELAGSDKRRARARALADEIERRSGSDLVEVRHQINPSENVALSSAILVRRALAAEVAARLGRSYDGVRILVNGPWPPYTFAVEGSD